jgi:hypothetical protein
MTIRKTFKICLLKANILSRCLHLRHFTGNQPQGHVWTYDADTGNCWSSIPEQTAKQTHFYSIEKPDGTMDTKIEEVLSEFEGRGVPAYEALLTGKVPKPSKERMYFSQFLGLMITRTPAMRSMYAEIIGRGIQIQNYAYAAHDEAFESLIRQFEKDTGQKIDEATKASLRQSMIDPSKQLLVLPQETTFTALKMADTLAPLFFDMKWSILHAKHGFFITSDNPVVQEVDPRTRHPFSGDGGFMNKTVEVTFPLSREVLLLMSWSTAPRKEYLERKAVDLANKARAAHSDRYLYAHIRHKHIQALAVEFKDSRPRMTTEGFGPDKFAPVKISRRSKK